MRYVRLTLAFLMLISLVLLAFLQESVFAWALVLATVGLCLDISITTEPIAPSTEALRTQEELDKLKQLSRK